jgi:hypothetical protein
MPRTDSFWALMRTGIAAGRRAWRPANICVFRAVPVNLRGIPHRLIQEIGLVQTSGNPAKFRMTFRLTKTRPGDSASRALLRAVKAVFRGPVSIGRYEGTAYIHLPLSSNRLIDASWKEMRALFGRSAALQGKRRANSGYQGTVRRGDRFITRIMKEGPGVWSPDYACFRRNRHISVNGFRYLVLQDGLWNEWDNEVSFLFQSADKITRDGWKEIKDSGLVEALAAAFGRIGYKVGMRARFYGDGLFVQFVKPVNQKTITLEARRLLNWRLPKNLPLRPLTRHSTRLFLPDSVL